jgi:Protein of unknown function (DUF2752)
MEPVVRSRLAFRIAIGTLAIAMWLVLLWTLRTYEPTASAFYPKCVFYQATGLHCPGCGATRSLHALANGEVLLAIRCNPLLIVGLPIILCVIAIQQRRERAGELASPKLAWVLFAILLIYMIGRNVPSPTRSPLAPPASPTRVPE